MPDAATFMLFRSFYEAHRITGVVKMKITTALLALSLWLGSAQIASAEMKQITCVVTGNSDQWVSDYASCTKDGFNSRHHFIIDTSDFAKDSPQAEYSMENCTGTSKGLTRVPLKVSATNLTFLVKPEMLRFDSTRPRAYFDINRETLEMTWAGTDYGSCEVKDYEDKNKI